jgi:hypothetical protein
MLVLDTGERGESTSDGVVGKALGGVRGRNCKFWLWTCRGVKYCTLWLKFVAVVVG